GLVMIEAFACGTPVIAYRHGSIPEIMEHGVTGFVAEDQDQAIRAAQHICEISRAGCRQVFENRFTVAHMAENYLRVYRSAVCDRPLPGHAAPLRIDNRVGTQ